jgi:PAS domain S-box-containing protein
MRFNTALTLLLLGGSLWFLKAEPASPSNKRLGQALAWLVLILNLLTLVEYVFGVNLHIDQFFMRDLAAAPGPFPGRIPPLAVLCAGLCSVSFLKLGSRISRYLSYVAIAVSLLIILNNLFDFQLLFGFPERNYIPAHTGLAFLLISFAIMAVRPAPELMEVLSSNLPGTRALRVLLLEIIALTFVFAWLVERGETLGVLNQHTESLFLVILLIFAYTPLIYFIARDINRAEARLQLSDQILARVTALVLVSDARGAISYVSPSVKTILGYEPAQLLGDGWWQVGHSSTATAQLEKERILAYASGEHAPSPEPYEQQIQDRTGNPHWIVWADALGPDRSTIGVGHDITERKKAEQALRQSEEKYRDLSEELEQRVLERTADLQQVNLELKKALHAKDEFMSVMSHELRTPLASILGLSEALLEELHGPLNESQHNSLHVIERSGQHLLQLINDILNLSKLEAGQMQIHPEAVEVLDICEASLALVREQALKKSLVLEFEPLPARQRVFADPRALQQILVDLLSNAVKFTPVYGQVTLKVTSDQQRGLMQFSINDTGIGIMPEDLSRIFLPFIQVDSRLSREFEGTGLGLALVQKMIDLHGGSIQVESEVGQGSRFTVSLPWLPAPTDR